MSLTHLYDVPAPAKLNLFLHIVGRRADGYHLLESVFVLVDWADTLHFERRADGQLRRHDLEVELPADDLCLRAARALQAAAGVSLGADISIAKRVPSGAGMGGGSSDAATVLLALNRLWGAGLSRERLLSLAASLGADVPFFVHGCNALVRGIGERLDPVELPPAAYAVAKPSEGLATAAIFGDPWLERATPSAIIEGSLASVALQNLQQGAAAGEGLYGHNNLQPVAERHCPAVAQAARWLADRFGNSRMTGSGSAVFARVGARVGAGIEAPSPGLADLPAGWVGRMCRSLAQHPLRGWSD